MVAHLLKLRFTIIFVTWDRSKKCYLWVVCRMQLPLVPMESTTAEHQQAALRRLVGEYRAVARKAVSEMRRLRVGKEHRVADVWTATCNTPDAAGKGRCP